VNVPDFEMASIVSYGIGYWLWVASAAILAACVSADIFHFRKEAAQAGGTLKLRVRLSGFDAICRMVHHGVGVAVIPQTAARHWRRPTIAVVRLSDAWSARKLMLCVRRFDDLPDHAQQLVDHLKAPSGATHKLPARTRVGRSRL
jgi:DNA-binding transcriptional LysR family regulator